jgi:hypothetical protein
MNSARRSTGPIALLLLLLVSGCSGSSTPRAGSSPTPDAGVPLTIVNPARVPAGQFVYLSAGPSSLNAQVIRVDMASGGATRITDLPEDQGVSTIYASGSHVVFASAALGRDHPYRLNTDSTYTVLSPDPGFRPIVAPNGDVAWARPVAPDQNRSGYEIHVLLAGKTRDTTVFSTSLPVIAGSWLKGNALALFVAGSNARIQILSLARKKITKTIKVSPDDAGYFAATPSGVFAVGNRTQGTLIRADGTRVALPSGWHPFAFSPDGRTILVTRTNGESQNELGLVSTGAPEKVTVWARLGLASLLDASWTSAG